MNQHWNSLCKLLQETLLRLEATYAEVRHVLQIRTEEFGWLDNCEHIGYMRRPIRGNLDTVQQEIESHEVSENGSSCRLHGQREGEGEGEGGRERERERCVCMCLGYTQAKIKE